MLTPHPLLLTDEPFDGLDLRQTREVGAALRAHAAGGRTLFLSIHQISDAARVCDRFVLLSGGPRLRRRHARRTLGAGRLARRGRPISRRSSLPLRKTPFVWLLEKEWRELLTSRAWWVLLLAMGPLVGVSFISAVRTYGEASGLNGTAAGVGEAFSPLVGIWAPTFSACELAAAFLLPFVAIRLVSGDRQSGALKLELQHPMPAFARIAAKALVLLAGWLIAFTATAGRGRAVEKLRRQHLRAGAGHGGDRPPAQRGSDDRARRGDGLARRASVDGGHPHAQRHRRHLDHQLHRRRSRRHVGARRGLHADGDGRRVPARPRAARRHPDRARPRCDRPRARGDLDAARRRGAPPRAYESIALGAIAAAAIVRVHVRHPELGHVGKPANSFPEADEEALRQIRTPLHIEAHLAAEDPRRVDLERQALSKLRRVMPKVQVQYVSATSIGLFEQTSEHYGEIWYDLGGRSAMSRMTTAEGVLETIYALAGVTPPAENDDAIFRGHPLAVPPKGAATVFYGIWPAPSSSPAGFSYAGGMYEGITERIIRSRRASA